MVGREVGKDEGCSIVGVGKDEGCIVGSVARLLSFNAMIDSYCKPLPPPLSLPDDKLDRGLIVNALLDVKDSVAVNRGK